jgi:hypothetical protein
VGTSLNKFLCKFHFPRKKNPRLIAVILGSICTSLTEPSYSFFDVIDSSKSFGLQKELIEVVAKLSSLENLVTKF